MHKKQTLLEKYKIPINHLDFKYIENCENAKEMEKIVQILRSEEEGYYPDLTKCAENKLRLLKPTSRLFLTEEPVRNRDSIPASEWSPFYNWADSIKDKDEILKSEVISELFPSAPPARPVGVIKPFTKGPEVQTKNNKKPSHNKIISTDYNKWNKFDPDLEILKMDLAEERVTEEVERKNRLNAKNSPLPPKVEDVEQIPNKIAKLAQNLSDIEREKLANDYRLFGNENFREKSYVMALLDYTRAIHMWPANAAGCYNNRAITYIKLEKYKEAIADCKRCIEMEPHNVKALLRQAEALKHLGDVQELQEIYQQVLKIQPDNSIALKHVPAEGVTRLKIEECTSKPKPAKQQYDLSELVKPNVIVKNDVEKVAEFYRDGTESEQLEPPSVATVKTRKLIEEL